jgi:hypothetical protein
MIRRNMPRYLNLKPEVCAMRAKALLSFFVVLVILSLPGFAQGDNLATPPSIICPDDMSVHLGFYVSSDFTVTDSDPGASIVSVTARIEFDYPSYPFIFDLEVVGGQGNPPILGHVEFSTDCPMEGRSATIWLVAEDNAGEKDSCSFSVESYYYPAIPECPWYDSTYPGHYVSDNGLIYNPDNDSIETFIWAYPEPVNLPYVVLHQLASTAMGHAPNIIFHVEWDVDPSEAGQWFEITVGVRDTCDTWFCAFDVGVIEQLIGDANGDGEINLADAVYLVNYLFIGGPPPDPLEAGDANCDGEVNLADAVYIVNYLFIGGPPPGCE